MNENNNKTEPEPLSVILTEMREEATNDRENSPDSPYNAFADVLESYADRIEAAVNRMRDAYCDLCKEKDEAYDRLLLERDKAIKANNGNVAVLRSALLIILDDARKVCKMDRNAIAKLCKDALSAIEKPAQGEANQ